MGTDDMTLRELCDACGVTRRAVQGYEKAGLVQPSGHDKHGYLLYDPAAQDRIRMIRTFQRFGFQVKEIRVLFTLPVGELRERLIRQKHILEMESAELDQVLVMLNEMIRQME